MRLNLACGDRPKEGWVNVDVSPTVGPDSIVDLLHFPWPWADGSAEEINCEHFLEHLGEQAIPFMDECWRVLKPGGTARFLTPYFTSERAWWDPTHKWVISEPYYLYFSKKWREEQKLSHYPIRADFEVVECRYHCYEEWKDKPEEEFAWARRHLWNVVADMEVRLRKVTLNDGRGEALSESATADATPALAGAGDRKSRRERRAKPDGPALHRPRHAAR